MSILKDLKTSVLLTAILLIVCCCIYPLLVFAAGQLLFSKQANGSLVFGADGKPIASTLIGQAFTADRYFNPRPSAAGTGYDSTSFRREQFRFDLAGPARCSRAARGRLSKSE